MGHDVRSIGNHNLQVDSLPALAGQLAARFGVNIRMMDEATDETSELWPWPDRAICELTKDVRGADVHGYRFTDLEGSLSLTIFQHYYINSEDFCPRWWHFCHCFDPKSDVDSDSLDMVEDFRRRVLKVHRTMGGTALFYLDDQGKHSHEMTSVAQGSEEHLRWEGVAGLVVKASGGRLLDVPRFRIDPDYREAVAPLDGDYWAFTDDFRDLVKIEHWE
jgi:hypothetical protein